MHFKLPSPSAIEESRDGNFIRLVLPYRQLTCYPTARRTLGEASSVMLISAFVAAVFASGDFFGFGPYAALLPLIVATAGSIVIVLQHKYLRTGKSRSEVLLGNFEILFAELEIIRWGHYRNDALAICRLRVLELPDYFFATILKSRLSLHFGEDSPSMKWAATHWLLKT